MASTCSKPGFCCCWLCPARFETAELPLSKMLHRMANQKQPLMCSLAPTRILCLLQVAAQGVAHLHLSLTVAHENGQCIIHGC